MFIRLTLIGVTLSGMMTPFSALAATLPTCNDMMNAQLGREERLYRSVIFGAAAAKDTTINGTVVDKDGNAFMKTNDNTWETTDPMSAGTTWTDDDMEKKRDVPARRGILEIRTALSSELIPPVLQAVRASQCRMQAVCLATLKARDAAADATTLNVQPDGCIAFDMPIVDSCRTVDLETFDSTGCMAQAGTIVSRESRILELIFAYDASYRTLMQFAGTFEGFLGDFRFPLLQPLWQMVRTLGQFDNLPCFQAECNE